MTRFAEAVQLSVAVARKLGTAASQLVIGETLTPGRHVIVGGVLSTTVKVVWQVLLFPVASVAVSTTVCMPRPRSVPTDGVCVMPRVVETVQLSVAVARRLGTAAWQFAVAEAVASGRHEIVGGVLSVTVKVVWQLLLLPAASVAVSVTVCVPAPTIAPTGGICVITRFVESVQLSVAVARKLGTAASQLVIGETLTPGRHVIVGGVLFTTVKVVWQVLLFPVASVAVSTTVCMPRPRSVPTDGVCVMTRFVETVQLSVAVARRLGTAAWQFAVAEAVASGRHVIVGGVLSVTVKVVWQLLLLPAASVAVSVTVCVPAPTIAPTGGICVITRFVESVQLSVAVARKLGTAASQLVIGETLTPGRHVIVGGVLSTTVNVV